MMYIEVVMSTSVMLYVMRLRLGPNCLSSAVQSGFCIVPDYSGCSEDVLFTV